MKTIDSDPNVTRIVAELKNGAAQRERKLSTIVHRGEMNADDDNDTDQILPDRFDIPLTLDLPLADKNQLQYALPELVAYDDLDFVHNAYQAILKRPPDPSALTNSLEGLRTGELDKIDLLLELRYSDEGREKRIHVSGLRIHRFARTLSGLPLLRFLATPIYGLFHWRSVTRNLQRSQGLVSSRQQSLVRILDDNRVLFQKVIRLFEEQKETLGVLVDRVAELTKYTEDRLNEEATQRQRQSLDRTKEIEDVRRVYNKYRTQVELTEKDLKREVDHLFRKYQEVKTELVFQTQKLALLEQAPISSRPVSPETAQPTHSSTLDPFFASFEEQFRGDREEVKRRLRKYLPLICKYDVGGETTPILDVACGRGEWLELLKEESLRASGIDINQVLVNQCRELNLEVVQADLLEYLRNLAKESMGAVSAFHIVEHLSVEHVISFLDQALRVLRTGGLLMIETPNPQNVLVGSCNFYFDLTHRNPIPLPVLKFLVESRGFVIVDTLELNPSDEKPLAGNSEVVQRLNQYFYGPMDYAVIACKV